MRISRTFIYLLIGVSLVILLISLSGHRSPSVPSGTLSEMVDVAEDNPGVTLVQKGDSLVLISPYGEELLKSHFQGSTWELRSYLEQEGISMGSLNLEVKTDTGVDWVRIVVSILPLLFLVGLFIFLMRGAQGGASQAFSFSRSKARLITGDRPSTTFADVAGVDEVKQDLQEIVEFLKQPQKFQTLGARTPHGILLVGPPGTGKTLVAKAVAGEALAPFFSISGSEFVEMFVGVGASRVRDLFEQAKKTAPSIIFIDEIDAVGRHRGAGIGGGHDEREQTLNQILVEMDGFDTSTSIIVMAATNRPDILDPALLRPGRFDRQVVLDRPDIQGRKAILEVHARGKPLNEDANLEVVAKETIGFTGADLANLLNEAAILAARRDKQLVGMEELEEAIDRVVAGPKKARLMTPKEKEITAYHEAGHALVAKMLPHADPVHKISIVSRGMMGGYTRLLPTEDRYFWTRSQFEDVLCVDLGGYVAEEVVFQDVTTGSSNDIEQTTELARKMITRYGMGELGPRSFGKREELVFLGKEITEEKNYSEKTAEEIDSEVHRLITTALSKTRQIILENRERLDNIVSELISKETLEGEDLERVLTPAPVNPFEDELHNQQAPGETLG